MRLFDFFINPVWHDISRLDARRQRIAAFLLTGYGSCRNQIKECLVSPLDQSSTLSLDAQERLIDEALVGFLKSCRVPQSDPAGNIPDRILQNVADVWGLFALADCNHRSNGSHPETLKGSLYSADPYEARTQVLVKWAEILALSPTDFVMDTNRRGFLDQWSSMTALLISGSLAGFGRVPAEITLRKARSEAGSLPAYQVAKARYMIQTIAKASVPESLPIGRNSRDAAQAPLVPDFYPASTLREHPFWHVPYAKMIALMQVLVPEIKERISAMEIEDYDLRRFMDVKDSLSAAYLDGLRSVDSLTLAYCTVVVATARREPKFIACGVWKKLSEFYRHEIVKNPLILIIMTAPTLPGMEDGTSRVSDIVTQVQRSARIYLASARQEGAGFAPLVSGTFLLKHVMNHPTYSTMLSSVISQVLAEIEPILDEMAGGELIPWPEQQKMAAASDVTARPRT